MTKLTVEKQYLKVAKQHCTKLIIESADSERPIELILFSGKELTLEETTISRQPTDEPSDYQPGIVEQRMM